MKYSKETVFDTKELFNTFSYYKMLDIVIRIIDRIDYKDINIQNDLYDCIIDAINEELIYTKDQWEVIEFYSSTSNPRSISDCCMELADEIYNCQF